MLDEAVAEELLALLDDWVVAWLLDGLLDVPVALGVDELLDDGVIFWLVEDDGVAEWLLLSVELDLALLD